MRLFVSLPMPDDARAALSALQNRLPGGRAVPEEQLHLTLAFLGDTDPETAHAMDDALSDLRAAPVALTLASASLFGGARGQAVGLQAEGGAALHELRDRVLSRLRGAGAAPGRRRFRPHVTLARLPGRADPSRCLAALTGARLGPFQCTCFALVQSRLYPDGAIHEPLALYPLG